MKLTQPSFLTSIPVVPNVFEVGEHLLIKTNSWVVSEYSTGMQIGGLELNTRKEAINYSFEYLSGWRKQVFASTVEKYEKINQ
jgi:hypothetical protein